MYGLRNLPHRFVLCSATQIYGGDQIFLAFSEYMNFMQISYMYYTVATDLYGFCLKTWEMIASMKLVTCHAQCGIMVDFFPTPSFFWRILVTEINYICMLILALSIINYSWDDIFALRHVQKIPNAKSALK